jgi:hypothetical protein
MVSSRTHLMGKVSEPVKVLQLSVLQLVRLKFQ